MDENEQAEAVGGVPTPAEVQAALDPQAASDPQAAVDRQAAAKRPESGTRAGGGGKRASAKKAPAKKGPGKSASAKKAPGSDAPVKKAPASDASVSDASVNEAPARKAPAKKAVAKEAVAKKSVAKQAAAKQAPVKQPAVKQAPVKQPAVKQPPVKQPAVKQAPVKKSARRASAPAGPPSAASTAAAKAPGTPSPVTKPSPIIEPNPVTRAAESVHAAEPVPAVEPVPEVKPGESASTAEVQRAWQDNSLAQVLYHDWEAGTYDEKWSISFDERCITYARDRFSSTVGAEVLRAEQWPYPKALEIGAGTGFFSLNLKQAGVLDEVHVSDVSAGMVEGAQRNARGLGFEVQGVVAGAESLPYPDDTFDLVIGHAVIHHIPDVEAALAEVLRVLRPGGRFVIAGEPTRIGDWYARRLGRVTWKLTTTVTRLPALREKWAKSRPELDASSRAAALEAVVDLHTFVPSELQAMAERAGAVQVHTQTEELLAAMVGWPVRTFEAAVNPKALGWGWARFAYRVWQRLSALDRVLSRALPESVFYNVGITGIKRYR